MSLSKVEKDLKEINRRNWLIFGQIRLWHAILPRQATFSIQFNKLRLAGRYLGCDRHKSFSMLEGWLLTSLTANAAAVLLYIHKVHALWSAHDGRSNERSSLKRGQPGL